MKIQCAEAMEYLVPAYYSISRLIQELHNGSASLACWGSGPICADLRYRFHDKHVSVIRKGQCVETNHEGLITPWALSRGTRREWCRRDRCFSITNSRLPLFRCQLFHCQLFHCQLRAFKTSSFQLNFFWVTFDPFPQLKQGY
jgi:hypothetical protein